MCIPWLESLPPPLNIAFKGIRIAGVRKWSRRGGIAFEGIRDLSLLSFANENKRRDSIPRV